MATSCTLKNAPSGGCKIAPCCICQMQHLGGAARRHLGLFAQGQGPQLRDIILAKIQVGRAVQSRKTLAGPEVVLPKRMLATHAHF
jgi:hypothetical protein